MNPSKLSIVKIIFIIGITLFFISSKLLAQQSQNELLKDFSATSLNVFKLTNPKYNKYVFEKVKKQWPIKLEKNGSDISKLVINRAGVIEEPYEPDLASYPAYFKDKKYRVVFVDGNFYYVTWSRAKATIKYVLTEKGSIDSDHEKHEEKVESYIKKTVAAQSGDRKQLAAKKVETAKAEKLANSLKGKSVKSIAVKWLETPSPLGHMTQVSYGIEAKLTDGSYLRTENLGGKTAWDDFKITVQGADFGEEQVIVSKDASKISSDKVIITAKSVHIPSLKATAELPIPFTAPIDLGYSGKTGGVVHTTISPGYRGKNGTNLKILVKAYTTKNGDAINKVEVRDGSGKVLHRLKMAKTATLNIYSHGGNGSFGMDDTRGGDGGDGGNITIIQDPSVSTFTYTVNNDGGNGGKHQDYRLYDGKSGSSGSTSKRTGSVNLSW